MSFSRDVDFSSNPDLTNEEKKAVRYYQSGGFQRISAYLYAGRPGLIGKLRETNYPIDAFEKGISKVMSTIKILDQAFLHCSLRQEYITYRGINNRELKDLRKLKIGDIYLKRGFLSLTYCREVALREDFAEIDENGTLNIMTMKIKKDSHAIFIGNTTGFMECEILLPRKRNLELIDVRSISIKELNIKNKDRIDISRSTLVNIFITQDVTK
jgi:hypothetical protein